MDGKQVPQQMVVQVGDVFKKILTEVPTFEKLFLVDIVCVWVMNQLF